MEYNPFFFGGIVKEEDFCNRIKEIEELKSDILSGINVLIYAPRRYGKTSLIFMLSKELEKEGIKTIYMDLFPLSSEEEFARSYFSSILSSLEQGTEKLIRLIKETLKFKPSFTVEVTGEGNISFNLQIDRGKEEKTLEEVLDLPYLYAQKTGKRLCIVFDEFQEIYRLGLSAKLRSVIQKHSRTVSYIFSGSRKSILEKMFSDRREPFYRSVKKLPLKPIGEEDWISFIKKKFEDTGKQIKEDTLRKGIRILEGHPHAVQQLFHFVWEETKDIADEDTLKRSLNRLMESEKDTFWYLWEELTNTQRRILKLIAHTEGRDIYKSDTLQIFSLSPSAVQKAVKSLLEKDIIDKREGKIVFQNPLLKLWLKENSAY